MQIVVGDYVFSLRWKVVLIVLMLNVICVKLGLWQWHKAEQKQRWTQALTQGQSRVPHPSAALLRNAQAWPALHMQRVALRGRYLSDHVFLLDNQLHQGQAGFHVLTPLLLDDQHTVLWINRGWVAGYAHHQQLPQVTTPEGEQQLTGMLWLQKKTAFRLDAPDTHWQTVQQVIDLDFLKHQLPYTMSGLIMKLDPDALAGGFVRDWQLPAGQVEKHLSYAYQWFGFAVATVLIGLSQMIQKRIKV